MENRFGLDALRYVIVEQRARVYGLQSDLKEAEKCLHALYEYETMLRKMEDDGK